MKMSSDIKWALFLIPVILLLIAVLIFGKIKTDNEITNLKSSVFSLEEKNKSNESENEILKEENSILKETLGIKEDELQNTKEKTDQLNKDVETISEIIKIDEELLQKYSKVYFLNEHYTPTSLSYIDDEYIANKQKPLQIQGEVKDNLEELLEDAKDDGVEIKVISAYRSFREQASLKYNYKLQFGSGANTFSADQGYSEHQLGTTVDLTTPAIGEGLTTTFDQTESYKWLDENAYKYGFVLSYPKGNVYYQYEPWHWRFVSKGLAKKLHRENKNFYDVDQRDTFEYLLNFFN